MRSGARPARSGQGREAGLPRVYLSSSCPQCCYCSLRDLLSLSGRPFVSLNRSPPRLLSKTVGPIGYQMSKPGHRCTSCQPESDWEGYQGKDKKQARASRFLITQNASGNDNYRKIHHLFLAFERIPVQPDHGVSGKGPVARTESRWESCPPEYRP